MQAFVAIVDAGSLTKAGEQLGKSPPTMVRTLADLERELGATLLQRTTRRMSLTEEGRTYLERCRRILADVAEVEEQLREGRGEPRGQLRVTAPVLFGQKHVAPAVIVLLERYRELDVELLLYDRVVNLVEEGVDVALRIGKLSDSTLLATSVGEMPRVLCASPALLRKVGTPKHPSELAQLPCIASPAAARQRWRFRDGKRALSVDVTGRLSINHVAAAIDACVAGAGFGSFLGYQVADAVRAKQLRVVLRRFEPPALPVSLVRPASARGSLRSRVFVEWLSERLRGTTWLQR